MLLEVFAGRTLRMIDIYNEHNVGRPYVTKELQGRASDVGGGAAGSRRLSTGKTLLPTTSKSRLLWRNWSHCLGP